jgi:hypothetical protein
MGPGTTGAQFQDDIDSLLHPPDDDDDDAENEEDARDKNDEAE